MKRIPKKIDRKWFVAGAMFLMVFTVLGFCSSSKSIYIAAITEALDISRSAFSINDSCRYITTSIVNVFFGALVARFGERKLIGAGFLCLITSMLLYSVGNNVFVFYLGGIFLGAGLSWTTTTMVGSVIGKWFKENKGTVMGAILAANGLGAALALQIVSPIIYEEGNPFGYRKAYRLVILILLVVGTAVVLLIRNKKQTPADKATPAAKSKKRGMNWLGFEFSVICKKPYFYGALACIFVTGMLLQGVGGVAAPMMRDTGLDEGYVATVLSLHSIALTVFKLGVGFVYDKKGLRTTANICFITAIAVFLLLANITTSPLGKGFALLYGIFSSLALPLETIMLPIFAADLFGERSYPKVLGIVASVNTAGYAVGAPVANICYDLTGTYVPAIYASALLMLGVFIAMQFVIRAAKKDREALQEPKNA